MDLFPRGFSGAVPHKDFATLPDVVDQLELFGFDRDAVQFVKDALEIKGEFQTVDAVVNTEAAIAFGWPRNLLP